MVVIVSPQLRALRDQRGVAEAQVVQAGLLPNPQLALEVDRPDHYIEPVGTQLSAGLTWEITALLSHPAQVAAARASAQSLDLSVAWQEWQVAQDSRLRAFRILGLERQLPLARAVEQQLAQAVELFQRAAAAGEKTSVDLTTATDNWTQAQNARFDLENQLTAEKAALNLALGLPADQPMPLKPAGAFPAFGSAATESAAQLLQGLEERRLDLVALRLGYASQEASLRAAVIQQFPKIGLGLVRTRDTSVPPIYTWGPSVAVDVPLFDRNQGQIAIARASRQQLFDEYVARVAQARSDVGQILANLALARQQLQTADASLPDLERLARSTALALQNRDSDLPAYGDATSALARRQMEQAQLQQKLLELDVALEIATGRPLLNRL